MSKLPLGERVTVCAQAVLSRQGHVSAVDMLIEARVLFAGHVDSWKRGRIPFLEQEIQWRGRKLSEALYLFSEWASLEGLRPEEAAPHGRDGTSTMPLLYSADGNPDRERLYRLRYFPPASTVKQRQKAVEGDAEAPDLLVYDVLRESVCGVCGTEQSRGSLLLLQGDHATCLKCAHLDHLVWLPRGDAALSRRARKHSGVSAIVLRFSRARKHYEREGLLVESAALDRARAELSK